MNMKFTVLIVFINLLPQLVHANGDVEKYVFQARDESNCSDLNIEMSEWYKKRQSGVRVEAPLNEKIGRVRNQGSIGWCFAYAAADMLSHGSGYNISAAQIAKNYLNKSKVAWIWGGAEGGLIDDAIDLSLKIPLCDEGGFSSIGLNIESANKKICENPVAVFSEYKTKKQVSTGLNAGGSTFQFLDNILAKGKIAGIHYNANKFFKGEKSNIRNSWANHASTIVARFYNRTTSTCNYLIRNSWGSSCTMLNNPKVTCFDGYYAAPEEVLNDSLNEVIELKKR